MAVGASAAKVGWQVVVNVATSVISGIMNEDDGMEMGDRIHTLRKRRVGSQAEFEEQLDVSVITVSHIENGMTKIDAELLIRMSEVLHAPVDLIL